MTRTPQQRRWVWFDQVRDMLVTIVGLASILTMLWRDSWPPLGVATALTCIGALTTSGLLRLLLTRWEGKGE